MRPPVLVTLALAASAALLPRSATSAEKAGARSDCTVHVGPNDLLAQDRDLVVPEGARVEEAVALRGDLRVRAGAVVRKAVAVGGSVTVEGGAVVTGDAVALGGDVRLEGDARVEGDAVAIGGQVRQGSKATVTGNTVGLALQLGGSDLARKILDGIRAEGPCQVVTRGR